MEKLPRILLTVIHQGWVRPEMFFAIELMRKDARVELDVQFLNNRPYENSLNSALKLARMGGHDFLITFDHDNFPKNNPLDLIFIEKDIIGMPYFGMQNNGHVEFGFLAMDKQTDGGYLDHRTMDGLQEVDAVASGALVLSKRVLDSGIYFERKWEGGFAIKGVDFYFCEKAKAAGFSIFAHYGYAAEHIKEVPLLEMMRS